MTTPHHDPTVGVDSDDVRPPVYGPPPAVHWVNVVDVAEIPLATPVFCCDADGIRPYVTTGQVFEQAGGYWLNVTTTIRYYAWTFLPDDEKGPWPRGYCFNARHLWVQQLGP